MAGMASDLEALTSTLTGPLILRRAFRVGSRLRPIYRAISCGAQWRCQGDPLDTDLKEVRQHE